MLDDLLPYYEKELSHLRFLGQEFARQYPKIASRLLIEGDNCEDPHAERLIEAFAFLAARVHKKLDDEFPEIVEAFLEILYPHYLRPTPSLSVVQFALGESGPVTGRFEVPRHTQLTSRAVDGVNCRFRTCYPVELWPIEVREAGFAEMERSVFNGHSADLVAHLRLGLACTGEASFATLDIQRLRFFLDGENSLMLQLYELLFNNLAKLTLVFETEQGRREVGLPPSSIKPVGFALDEGLVDYSERSFLGYRLLHEYFTFPDKFMFFDLEGIGRVLAGQEVRQLEINLYFSDYDLRERLARLAQNLGRGHFKLGCTPIVNLFPQQAEPIKLSHTRHEYPVIPDVRQQGAAEVVSIDRVQRVRKASRQDHVVPCHPFFEPRGDMAPDACYWIGRRRPSQRAQDRATDVAIRLVDRQLELLDTGSDTLSIALTCSNRDLPQHLPYGSGLSDFTLERDHVVRHIRCLRKPTAAVRPSLGGDTLWRLVAHLSLNHMSLAENGREALLEMLALYNYREASAIRKQLDGIVSIRSESRVHRIGHPRPNFVRGVGITLELDESQYIGSGIYLFGTVLEHFFGLYCSVNSFTQLTLRSRQREKRVVQWPPRTGTQPLV